MRVRNLSRWMGSRDKKLHLLAGLALSILAGLFVSPKWGLIVATVIGALKEIVWDWWWKKGTPEWWDFWATVVGGLIGSGLILLVK